MKKTTAQIQQEAKRIIDEFAKALSSIEDAGEQRGEEGLDELRSHSGDPVEGFRERMMRNVPGQKDGQPRMERKGW